MYSKHQIQPESRQRSAEIFFLGWGVFEDENQDLRRLNEFRESKSLVVVVPIVYDKIWSMAATINLVTEIWIDVCFDDGRKFGCKRMRRPKKTTSRTIFAAKLNPHIPY